MQGPIEQLLSKFFCMPNLSGPPSGDMISGGTGAGTAADSSQTGDDGKPLPDRFLKPGDVVDITAPQIGTLRTYIGDSE